MQVTISLVLSCLSSGQYHQIYTWSTWSCCKTRGLRCTRPDRWYCCEQVAPIYQGEYMRNYEGNKQHVVTGNGDIVENRTTYELVICTGTSFVRNNK